MQMIAIQSIEYQDKKIVLSATVPLKNQLPNQRTKNTSPPKQQLESPVRKSFILKCTIRYEKFVEHKET